MDLPAPPVGRSGWPWETRESQNASVVSAIWKLPRITIVTPSYNQGAYLEETIRSVLLQGYPNLEYFIIDGGSSDDSVSIIRKYSSYLAGWCSESDRGQAHAINKGFQRATGAIYGFLNSDDLYTPGILWDVAQAYQRADRKWPFWRAYAVENFNQDGRIGLIRPKPNNSLRDWLFGVANLHQPGVFWSSVLHGALGGFDESLHYAFDRKFFVTALMHGFRFDVDENRVAAMFRYHPQSKTVRENEAGRFVTEIDEIGSWVRGRLSVGQRLKYYLHSFYGRDLDGAMNLLLCNSEGVRASQVFLTILRATHRSPSVLGTRYFYGWLRKLVRDAF